MLSPTLSRTTILRPTLHKLGWAAALLGSLALAGCGAPSAGEEGSKNPAATAESTSAAEGASAAQTPAEPEVAAKVVDLKTAQEIIAAQKGKIVVVDIWATHCEPCVREFPHLVALQKKYPEQLACISISSDYIGLEPAPSAELQETVLSFLKEKDAKNVINLISSTPDEKLYEELELSSIPVVYVYGRDGKLVKRFDNEQAGSPNDEFTYADDVIPLVEKLVKENQER